MKLYVNKDKTRWAGTQADAKKEFGMIKPYEVPVDKAGLIAFLNNICNDRSTLNNICNDISTVVATPLPVRNEIISQANPPKDTLVGRCSMVDLKELSTMMNVLINRTWNSMDRLEAKV